MWGPVTSMTLKPVVVMGTFYLSTCQSPYFFTLTWVNKCSQYFYFYQSIFKHEYLYFYLSKGCVYFCHLWLLNKSQWFLKHCSDLPREISIWTQTFLITAPEMFLLKKKDPSNLPCDSRVLEELSSMSQTVLSFAKMDFNINFSHLTILNDLTYSIHALFISLHFSHFNLF